MINVVKILKHLAHLQQRMTRSELQRLWTLQNIFKKLQNTYI